MKGTKDLKTNKGITLIALVITIIVMLILVAVTISMAVNGGLFDYARKAVGETQNEIEKEQELGSEKITIDNKVYNSIDEYLNGDTEESTLKPMVLKLNVQEGVFVQIGVYRDKYYEYDEEGNEIVTELPDTDVTIDWGDGEVEHYTSSNINDEELWAEHEYSEPDEDVTVTITGKCNVIELGGLALTEIKSWGNTETYYYNFSGASLVSIPAPEKNTFKNVISFENTFQCCENLTSLPEGLFANCTSVKSFGSTFNGCSSLTSLPENLFANCSSVKSFSQTFMSCGNLTSLPGDLFADCSSVETFHMTFSYCDSLLSIPESLFDNCINVEDFGRTFELCSSLTGPAIPLWERVQDPDEDYRRSTVW